MALKLRKDIKKSSYYVWFLGAKESKGLRGSEYILPVIKHLEEREKDVEPFKVTLQVSHKGLKIIQNIVSQGQKNSKPKNETIKHFIPHNTITCVYQHDDIIACILLLFNPVTKCPLHVHAYRCDSLETATLLKQQLQTLIERPENQKKFAEIENRLKPQKELKKVESSIGSDTGTSTRESESSEERFAIENSRVSTLYDSVAAELRAKLGKKNSPILLPPRDYDTVHRQKGNLTGIELRRCLNANIVGQNVKGRRIESSGGSSGIGSDHPPSPESPDAPDSRFNTLDNQSTSEDEDWNGDPAETTLYLMHSNQVTLPRPLRNQDSRENVRENREKSPEPMQRFSRYAHNDTQKSKQYHETMDFRKPSNKSSSREENNNISKYLEKPIAKFSDNKYLERQRSLDKERDHKLLSREKSFVERDFPTNRPTKTLEKASSNSNSEKYYAQEKMAQDKYYYQDRGKNHRDERYQENGRRVEKEKKPAKYFEDDGFDEKIRYRNNPPNFDRENERSSQRFSYGEEEFFEEKQRQFPVPKTRQKYSERDDNKYYNKENRDGSRPKFLPNDPRFYSSKDSENVKSRSPQKSLQSDRDYYEREFDRNSREEKSLHSRNRDYYEETTTINRRNPQFRQRSPSPDDVKAPRDRFKDAKEKFLLMERERLEQERRRPEPPISPTIHQEKMPNFIKRNDSINYASKEHNIRNSFDDRYYDDSHKSGLEENRPKPAPRHIPEEVRYREHRDVRDRDIRDRYRERDVTLERYRNTDKFDPKRRSMFSLIEEEHRKNSNEIAKELKRRSYMEASSHSFDNEMISRSSERDLRERHFQDLPEADRYDPQLLENYSKSSAELDKTGDMTKYDPKFVKNPQKMAGYRHSYAEPKMRIEKNGNKKLFAELLHRTNSSVSNGRVGIASVHPY